MNGTGRIVRLLDDGKAVVKIAEDGGCADCPARCNCMMNETRECHVTAVNGIGAVQDDFIAFEAHSGRVVLSALMIWILPIIAMIVGYVVAARFATGFVPILSALVFLAASFGFLRLIDNVVAGGTSFYPRITRILPESDTTLSPAGNCPQQPDRC